jgi:Cu/Ag efflux pump CusA
LPGALAGIVWMLFITETTLSVPALTGALMCMGIATANSVLLVSFAREKLEEGLDATAAALEAGFTRLRPVMMTALAMVVGMMPMALAMGDGGEQNAPLGRAVIGGLLVATWPRCSSFPRCSAFYIAATVAGPRRDRGPNQWWNLPRDQGEPVCRNTKTRRQKLRRRSGSRASRAC